MVVNSVTRWTRLIVGVVSTVGLLAGAAHAQSAGWPNKPIRFVNPFPAGGGTDTFARPMAAVLSKQLGQQVVIENLGGAGGTVGAAVAAKAAGDGYTFMVGAIHHTIAPSVYPKLQYDLLADFVPVTVLAFVPNVVVAQPKYGFNNMKDLITHAKANPGKLSFATPGSGTSQQFAAELVKVNQGINLLHVPYKGMGPAVQDFLGGTVDLIFDGMGASAAQIRAGKMKPLGLMATKRSAAFPDIPTLAEQGLPGLEVTTWYALWAVKGTPPEIVDRMHAEVMKAAEDPIVKTAWGNASAEFPGMSRAEFGRFIGTEMKRWGEVAKAANVKLDN
jgi:tripartite-type tricarboxylate transporter receptor subunit TctC